MTQTGHFLFCNVGWVDAQERHGTTVPYENEIFVNNWRAWRIREYTIKKILKNRSVRDFFDFIYCVSRRTHSHQKIHRTTKVRFFFCFYIILVVRKYHIQKTLNFINLRTPQFSDTLPRSTTSRFWKCNAQQSLRFTRRATPEGIHRGGLIQKIA